MSKAYKINKIIIIHAYLSLYPCQQYKEAPNSWEITLVFVSVNQLYYLALFKSHLQLAKQLWSISLIAKTSLLHCNISPSPDGLFLWFAPVYLQRHYSSCSRCHIFHNRYHFNVFSLTHCSYEYLLPFTLSVRFINLLTELR